MSIFRQLHLYKMYIILVQIYGTTKTVAAFIPDASIVTPRLQITKKVPAAGTFAKKIQLPCHCSSFRLARRRGGIYLYLGKILHLFYETSRQMLEAAKDPGSGYKDRAYLPFYLPVPSKPCTRYRPTGQRTTGVIGWIQLSRLGSFSFGSQRSPFLLGTDR